MSDSPNRFVWHELMTSDVAAAQAFYQAVVGWEAKDAEIPGLPYTLLTVGGKPAAGLMSLSDETSAAGAVPGWLAYIGVDQLDEAVQRIAEAGGTVHHPPQAIAGVGRFAIVADPHGAAFGLFSELAARTGEQTTDDVSGHFGWHELQAGELSSAFDFYARQFGWTRDERIDMGPMGIYQLFATGGAAVGGMMTRMPEVPVPFWLYYINVADIDAATERIGANAGQVVNGPMQVPGGSWIVQAIDPQGAMFALVGPRA